LTDRSPCVREVSGRPRYARRSMRWRRRPGKVPPPTQASPVSAWPSDALDHVWRPTHWLDDPPAPATTRPLAEIALVGGVAAAHIADHRVVPTRFHIGTHLLSAAAAVAAALGAGATLTDLGLRPDRMTRGLRRGL